MQNCKSKFKIIFLALIFFGFFGLAKNSQADTTSGGVNWLDPLQYTKPQFYPITVPDEASAPKYYTVLSGGSGSACNQGSPCNFSTVSRTSGPAYIYVKGSGQLIPNSTLYGSAGNEIVIKPWPGDDNVVTMQAVGTNGPSEFSGANVHHIIIDGGPNLQFDFIGPAGCTDQNTCYGLRINSNYITVARSRLRAHTSYGAIVAIAVYTTGVHDLNFLNNEWYDSDNVSDVNSNEGIYFGPCACNANCSSGYNIYIRNNIFRHIGGTGLEVNFRTSGDNIVVDGNAFHDLGIQSCNNTTWWCRPAVIVSDSCTGGGGSAPTNVTISNNLMWNTGGGAIRSDGGSGQLYYNNTIYNYGIGTGPGVTRMEGINSYNTGYFATIENNAIYAPNGTTAIYRTSGTKSNNLCASGQSCGTSMQTYNASTTWLATDSNNANFLKIGASSEAVDHGTNVSVTSSYDGTTRPQPSGGAYDIGAYEYTTGVPDTTPPAAPSGLSVS